MKAAIVDTDTISYFFRGNAALVGRAMGAEARKE